MPRVDEPFVVRHVDSRRYLRRLREGESRAAAQEKVRGHLRRANQRVTPRRTGRLRRSFRVRPQTTLRYTISWAVFYASFVNTRGRSKGFVNRVKRRAQVTLRTEARSSS